MARSKATAREQERALLLKRRQLRQELAIVGQKLGRLRKRIGYVRRGDIVRHSGRTQRHQRYRVTGVWWQDDGEPLITAIEINRHGEPIGFDSTLPYWTPPRRRADGRRA